MIVLPSTSFVPSWLCAKQSIFQRGVGLGFISHEATKTQRRQEEAYPQSSAPPRLRASQREELGSREAAKSQRESGLDSRCRANDGEAAE